ncbi:MAG: hypothetical protein MHPSP_002519, partial [Paramarteilia canceri]
MSRKTIDTSALEKIVHSILDNNRGILAADESPGTMGKRFGENVENTIEKRMKIRKMFFETPGLNEYIGGVILHEETLKCPDTIKPLNDAGIILGIKTDKGLETLANADPTEKTTAHGLKDLAKRNEEFYKLGARFAKWRAVLIIGDKTPTAASYEDVAESLGQYALISQQNGLVPIIEPEVLPDGLHSIEKSREVTEKIIELTLLRAEKLGVHMPGALLKVNMVTQGAENSKTTPHDVQKVAEMTVDSLTKGTSKLKKNIGGVVFLSGGLSEIDSSKFLNAINKQKNEKSVLKEVPLHFSFARALQKSAIALFNSNSSADKVHESLKHRCKMNSMATKYQYTESLEGGNLEKAKE